MAFWNAPLDNTKHCKDSIKSALEMLEEVKKFNDEIAKEGVPPFGMGIGINTGTVVVGNMGSDQRFDYTCLGDSVNLASRLEGQSKNYGVLIVLGPITAARSRDAYQILELDCIAVKGKTQGVNIYTVVGVADTYDARDAELHDLMLGLYRQRKFDSAAELCRMLKGKFDGKMDDYYDIWIERCADMTALNLPEDWDGVFRATTK
jgi:adenylate cyclase